MRLGEHAEATNKVRTPLGRTLAQVIGRVSQLEGKVALSRPRVVDQRWSATEQHDEALAAAGRLASSWAAVSEGEDFVWRGVAGRVSSVRPLEAAREALAELVARTDQAAQTLRLASPTDVGAAHRLLALISLLREAPPLPPTWLGGQETGARAARRRLLSALLQRLREVRWELESEAGPRWRELDAGAVPGFRAGAPRCVQTEAGWAVPQEAAVDDLQRLAAFLRTSVGDLRTLADHAATLQRLLGLEEPPADLPRLEQLAELAALANTATPPGRSWLASEVLQQLDQARQVLSALTEEYLQRQATLQDVFTDDVLGLDLERLHARMSATSLFGRLGKDYRGDKKLLAPTTRRGKVDKQARERLVEARDWQGPGPTAPR